MNKISLIVYVIFSNSLPQTTVKNLFTVVCVVYIYKKKLSFRPQYIDVFFISVNLLLYLFIQLSINISYITRITPKQYRTLLLDAIILRLWVFKV